MISYDATARGPLKAPGYIDPDDKTIVNVSWGAPVFAANTVYLLGDICRPTTDNGYYYTVTTAGKSSTEPATWSQTTQTSGTVTFKAVAYDLFVLPAETIQASAWTITDLVTTSDPLADNMTTSVVVGPVPDGVTVFELTNQITKSNGEMLSRTFRFKVNEQ